jgi:hypothetical protein
MKKLTVFFILIALAPWAVSQDQNVIKYLNTITKEDLKKHLSVIASDSYQGRGTGDKSLEMTAQYLEAEFAGDMLTGPIKGAANPFYQEFELEKKWWEKFILSTDKSAFTLGKDLVFFEMPEGNAEYELVFVGYSIKSDKYNDFKNIDVKNKLVAFMLGEPRTKNGKYLVNGTEFPAFKTDSTLQGKFNGVQSQVMAAFMHGAKGIILIDDDEKTMTLLSGFLGRPQMDFPGKSISNMSFPVIYASTGLVANLFGTDIKKFRKKVQSQIDKGKSPAGLFNTKIRIEAEKKKERIKTGNVVAMIEGTDKKDEYLIVCAHYDHDGIKNGEIYNGADDNGSGTVALIEMAEAFSLAKTDGKGPRRTIVFMALTAEEKGLLGSKYYVENPIFSLDKTVTALNIDMVGRRDKTYNQNGNYLYIIGSDRLSTELHQINENTAKLYAPELILDYTYNAPDHPENMYERSDHYPFAEKGIPAIFYFSGLHDDYHTPNDDVELIDFESYEKRVRLIFATAWKLANADERVKTDK